MKLNQKDIQTLEKHRLSPSQVETQFTLLRQGIVPLTLIRPCLVRDGILQLSPVNFPRYHSRFTKALEAGRMSKFIPASGAATRMFDDLQQFLDKQGGLSPSPTVDQAWKSIHQFPFLPALEMFFRDHGKTFQELYQAKDQRNVFHTLLHQPGLGYSSFPKALLPFHRYPTGCRTPLEEHVQEGLRYVQETPGSFCLHFTVSPPFENAIENALHNIQQSLATQSPGMTLTFSIQKSSTDTIALDSSGEPFRNEEGVLLLRPGGHGALLENLNDVQGDIVFISNIDNVVPDHLKTPITEWRKHLAGVLLLIQEQTFQLLHMIEVNEPLDRIFETARTFIEEELRQPIPSFFQNPQQSEKVRQLWQWLNRPIRVCGMVSNTGDPGGGPFWVQDQNGTISCQIVEHSQINTDSDSQQVLFVSATHFNPVDMVCGVRDYQGHPFNLRDFVDPGTSFISQKSYQGRSLTALEWPGLWNGGMAKWITLFVEIPRSNFNPVKSFMDWLHSSHQPHVS